MKQGQFPAILPLASLNGQNGFKLDGETSGGDQSGYSVSAAGDINGDGYVDLLIGADGHTSWTGRSYVVFGGPGVGGAGGGMALSSLNGATGFKLDSELSGDHSGWPLSVAGDINSDGVVDMLIGAYGYNGGAGRSYVVFGDAPSVLVNNSLYVWPGGKIAVHPNNLGAYDRNHNNNSLVFIPTALQHGYFSTLSAPTTSLVNFTQSQIIGGAIQFVHDGTGFAPSYNITVRSAGIAWTGPLSANMTFGPPTTTSLPTTTALTTPAATSTSSTPSTVQTPTPSVTSVTTSTVIQTTSSAITGTSTPSIIPTPTSMSALPVLLNNQLTLSNGQTVILSSNNLQASEVGFNSSQLIFSVGNVQNGYFSTVPVGNSAAKNIMSLFYISDLSHGHFVLTTQPQTWLSFFSQGQLDGGQVQFVQDGSLSIPGYSASVKAFGLQSASLPAGIFFTPVNESPPSSSGGESGYSTVQKAIIGAVVSGTIGIFFAVLQGCLKRASNKKLLQALGEGTDEYDLTVVRPVAKEIARQIKITGFMSSTTNTEMSHFKSAVRTILFQLAQRGVDLSFTEMKPALRDGLINEIARQTRKILLPGKSCCRELTSFFKAQTTPEEIEKAAPAIAEAVYNALTSRSTSSSRSPALEMSELSSLKNTLLGARSSSQVPPVSLSGVDMEPPRQERESAQVLGS